MLFTQTYFNPLYTCIENQFSKGLDVLIENDMMKWLYPNEYESPLIAVIKSTNVALMKKIFDYLCKPEHIKFISSKDMHFLLTSSHPEIDNFLARLPQKIIKFNERDAYIPTLTPLKNLRITYNKSISFWENNYNDIIKKKKILPVKKIEKG